MIPTVTQDMAMGTGIIAFCLLVFSRRHWFLAQTSKGQRLVALFGPERAPVILSAILFVGITFGALLARGTIRPVQW